MEKKINLKYFDGSLKISLCIDDKNFLSNNRNSSNIISEGVQNSKNLSDYCLEFWMEKTKILFFKVKAGVYQVLVHDKQNELVAYGIFKENECVFKGYKTSMENIDGKFEETDVFAVLLLIAHYFYNKPILNLKDWCPMIESIDIMKIFEETHFHYFGFLADEDINKGINYFSSN